MRLRRMPNKECSEWLMNYEIRGMHETIGFLWRVFAVDASSLCGKVEQDHPHDGPRTWIRGRMAPRRLRPAGFFLPASWESIL